MVPSARTIQPSHLIARLLVAARADCATVSRGRARGGCHGLMARTKGTSTLAVLGVSPHAIGNVHVPKEDAWALTTTRMFPGESCCGRAVGFRPGDSLLTARRRLGSAGRPPPEDCRQRAQSRVGLDLLDRLGKGKRPVRAALPGRSRQVRTLGQADD